MITVQLEQRMWLSGALCMSLEGYAYITLVGITKFGFQFAVS